MLYTPDLVTLTYVRQHRRLQTTETGDDILLQSLINEASADFQRAVGRVCMPYYAAHTFDYQNPYMLTLRGYDLLAVTTLTNGDSATISSGNYVLRSSNLYPKWRVQIKQNASTTFTWSATPEEAISIAGWWGYAPNYPSFWTDTALDIPAGNITSSSTSFTLVSTSGLEVGMYVKVEDEIMQVTALTSTVVTHTRAELGTTAAAHNAGVAIYRANALADIQFAVREMVVYQYLSKDRTGGRVQVYDGGVMTVEDLDPRVNRAIREHGYKQIVSV